MLEDHPKIFIGFVVLMLAAWFGVTHLVNRHNERVRNAFEEVEGGGREQVPETNRLKEVRLSEYKDPDRALKLVEAILASPADSAERTEALKKHANILQVCFHKRAKAGMMEEARHFMDRLMAEYPEAYQVKGVQRTWSEEQKRLCREHLQAGRNTEARAVLQSLSAENLILKDARILGDFQKALAEAWIRSGESPDSMQPLVEAAGVLAKVGGGNPLASVMQRSRIPGNDLLSLANAQSEGSTKFNAIALYQVVLARLNQNSWHPDGRDLDWEKKQTLIQQIEHRMTSLYYELGKAMEAGQRPLITAYDPEELYREAASQMQSAPLRAYLVRRQLRLQAMRLEEISKPIFEYSLEKIARGKLPNEAHNDLNSVLRESGNLAENILRQTGARLWTSVVQDPKFDPWPLIPPALKAEFDARRQDGHKEESLRQSLGSYGGRRDFMPPLPELAKVRQRQCEINARRGLIIHIVQPGECVNWLRKALANNADPEFRSVLTEAVSKAVLNSRGQKKFDAFYELTRFFVGDIGLENLPADRRDQFEVALGEAAESLASREPPKAIFLWAIQAEAYAGTAAGVRARTMAMKAAHRQVARAPLNEVKAASLPPSGRPGVSVLSVDNSTEYHLLVFYRGPESFFLACRPHRKVSAIARDGDYEVAVITPSGAIQPYRGKVGLNGSWQKSNYRIESSRESEQFAGHYASSASGTYQLAHRPSGLETIAIDPKTGGLRGR